MKASLPRSQGLRTFLRLPASYVSATEKWILFVGCYAGPVLVALRVVVAHLSGVICDIHDAGALDPAAFAGGVPPWAIGQMRAALLRYGSPQLRSPS